MKGRAISAQDVALLQEVLQARASERVDEVIDKLRGNTLAPAERTWLCELIGAEFAATGLGPDSEPTARGERLEHLLDTINRPNITGR
jgi:hypothetical protein